MKKQQIITDYYRLKCNCDITKYLTLKECCSLGWNIEKINKAVADKKILDKVFNEVYVEGFISNKELKAKFQNIFNKYGITLTAKASLITECKLYKAEAVFKWIDGKSIRGYILSKL